MHAISGQNCVIALPFNKSYRRHHKLYRAKNTLWLYFAQKRPDFVNLTDAAENWGYK